MGKFARVCLKTPYIDYNGRLCMVSAGAGNKKAFGIDRAANPWSDIPKAELIWISGANVAECAPITTEYVWQARENGARIIVVDPRITPLARTCDLFLPVKPGRDIALFNGVLHLMIEKGWIDRPFIEQFTVGFDKVAEHVLPGIPRKTAEVTGIPERLIRQAAEWWGTAKSSFLMHARGIEHHSHGVQNVARHDQHRAGLRPYRARGVRLRHDHRPGQRPGRARARAEVRPAPRLARHLQPRGPRPHRQHLGHRRAGHARPRRRLLRDVPQDRQGRDQGPDLDLLQPEVSLPDNNFIARALGKLEFYVAIDFFMNETARHADIVLPGSLQEEDEGVVTQIEGRSSRSTRPWTAPAMRRQDWRIIQDIAAALDGPRVHVHEPRAIFDELRSRQQGRRRRLLGHHLREDRAAVRRLLAVLQRGSEAASPSITRARRGCSSPALQRRRQGRGALLLPRRQGPLQRRSVHAAGGGRRTEYPLMLTTGRVVSQFLSGTQTRRIGPLVDQYPEPRIEMHPRLAERMGIKPTATG
jgi:assimilatory nitrate reductase catalytic subunit